MKRRVNAVDLLSAMDRAMARIQRSTAIASAESSAGIKVYRGKPGHRDGYQVFVKVCRFSEELLTDDPDSGGLIEESR